MLEVDVPGYCLQWIAQGFDLLLARCISEEVELDGAADLRFAHAVIVALAGVGLGWETGVFRGSQKILGHYSILTTARYTHLTSHTNDQMSVRIEALMSRFNIDWGVVK